MPDPRIALVRLVATLAVGATSLAGPAAAHRLSAQGGGVTCYDAIPCDATHIDGNFEVGVPGVNPNYFYMHTSADSDTGHTSIASAFSWLEGTKPYNGSAISDVIEENVDLHRLGPGPAGLRATLVLSGGGHAQGALSSVKLNGTLAFSGCQVFAEKLFTDTISTDLEPVGECGGPSLEGSALVVTALYDGQFPTHPLLRVQLQSVYSYLGFGSVVDFQWEGDLYVELINATATWDTPTFLTQVPEPAAGGLDLAVVAALAWRLRRTARRADAISIQRRFIETAFRTV